MKECTFHPPPAKKAQRNQKSRKSFDYMLGKQDVIVKKWL